MNNLRLILFLILLPLLLHFPTTWADSTQDKSLKIIRITPEGDDVPAGRQIVVTFNQAVVSLGNMARQAEKLPIVVTPSLSCQWRWLDTSNLACQLGDENALKQATRYQVKIAPHVWSPSLRIDEAMEHTFITERPSISSHWFKTWQSPGKPVIGIAFNQAVTQTSVTQHLYIQHPHGKRVAITAEIPSPEATSQEEEHEETPPQKTVAPNPSLSDRWLISPQEELPLDTAIKLMVEPGLQSELGPEPGVRKETVIEFHTFPKFSFLGVKCTSLKDEEITVVPGEKWSDRCDPVASAALLFSSPVMDKVIKNNVLITPDLAGGRTDYDPWGNEEERSRLDNVHTQEDVYRVWLPEILKAYEVYQLKSDSKELKDEFGRSLDEPINLQFATDHRSPRHVFEHPFSVLEQDVDSELPIYVTNLKRLDLSYNTLTPKGWSGQQTKSIKIPKVQDIAFKMPLGIRELFSHEPSAPSSGVVQGYFLTAPDINNANAPTENWFFSQVTPFHVQAKLGHHNTLVWVTDFSTGLPVSGVVVDIYQDTYAPQSVLPEALASAITDENGIAMLPGTSTLDPQLKVSEVYNRDGMRFFVRCQKEQDVALLPLDYEFKVQIYDLVENPSFYPSMLSRYGHIHTWGTTAQGIYKVGDTIQYKIFIRDQSNRSFISPPKGKYTLKVIDPKGQMVHEVKTLTLSEFGTFAGELTVPKNAPVGWYRFELSGEFDKKEEPSSAKNEQKDDSTTKTWYPMQVLVSDFTPAPFKVQTTLNGELFHAGDTVQVDTTANLHAGGPYSNAQSKINALLSQEQLTPSHPQVLGFSFDVSSSQEGNTEETIHTSEASVNDHGQLQTDFVIPEQSSILYGQLTVESAVRDDRGKDVAHRTHARYVGRDRFVGLKETSWLLTAGQEAQVLMVVVDEWGNPVTQTEIKAQIERKETKATRVKGAGNAYLTQYQHEWLNVGHCEALSQTMPVSCQFVPPQAGDYRVIATITDTKGRAHHTTLSQWALGQGVVVWETSPGNGLDLKAEKATYQVGETARYVVKNPYPGAKALITVERLGTLKSWVKTFSNSVEFIEIPVEPDYVPGFFVSVMVMSPRVEKPIDQDQVDLGKPAFRMGYVKTMVSDPYKELMVEAHSDQAEYRPRQTVTLNLQVKPKHPETKPQPVELAITVLDEAVFDLLSQGRDYFDPYKGFYTLDDLDMANFSLLMRLVGRQKFEKKGANAGGDGGLGLDMRSVFKYVSYWNPALKTDAEGKAQIQVTVPDNLTAWRVFAMAVTPTDQMGLGETSFKVNLPIEIRPALPNQVSVGDSFQAGFTVMNRTDHSRELRIELGAKGPVEILGTPPNLLKTEPFKRYPLWLPLKTTGEGTIEFHVVAKDAEVQDGLTSTLLVHKRRSLDTAATYGSTVEKQASESIEFPVEIYPDAGGVTVVASPTVIGGIEGAFEYMRDYPYACWEQKLSKGVMAAQYHNLSAYLPHIWQDSQPLPAETLKLAAEYQAPNGGMSFWIAQDAYVSPYLSAYTALAFNWLRESGYPIPDAVENKLHEYLLSVLRKEVMPNFYSKGMSSSVRAVALAALAKHGKIARADIKRYQLHLKNMDLFGKAMFLYAALRVPNTENVRTEVAKALLARADQTAGKVSFQETLDDEYKHILFSSLKTQCAILSTLVQYDEVAQDHLVSDIPFKLLRNITQARKNPGHWENTQENLFCMSALVDFARIYEKEPPAMTVQAWLEDEKLGETQFHDVKAAPVTFSHAMTSKDPGRKAQVKLEKEGSGRVYYTFRLAYAAKQSAAQAVNAGIEINREYHVERNGQWVLLTSPMEIKTGELVRVDLYVSLPAPRYFIVVDDPVPGGLEPVNRDLATTSEVDAAKGDQGVYAKGSLWFKHNDWEEYGIDFGNFYHKELRDEAARFYADYLPVGNYHLSYVAQAIAPGEFSVMPAHVEEMYEPEVYGKSIPAALKVIRDPRQ